LNSFVMFMVSLPMYVKVHHFPGCCVCRQTKWVLDCGCVRVVGFVGLYWELVVVHDVLYYVKLLSVFTFV
jgi:hypothetical protein